MIFESGDYLTIDLPGWVRLKASFRGPYIVSPAEYERLRTLGCDMKHFVVSTPLPEKTDDL